MKSFWRSVAVCSLVFAAALVCLAPITAQQTLGSINGTVLDSTGAAIPGATVTVTDSSIGISRVTTTQDTGFYQIFNLPVGTYTVKVAHEGFDTTTVDGIHVLEAQARTVSATLQVGRTSESVEVTANPLLNATDATNGYTLDTSQIEMTPLATGSFTQLAVLSPGVNAELLSNLDSNAGLGNQNIWANGQRATSNTFQVNGADSTNLFNGMSSSGDSSQRWNFNIGTNATVGGSYSVGTSVYGSNGNSLPSPPPEFLQELRVNTSMYDAQQGATAGAQIDVNTATGTNDWHGQVYGSYANNSLNASPFFFNQAAQLAKNNIGVFPDSLANPWLNRWDAGFAAGGPILHNKVFFFVAYEHRGDSDRATGISQLQVPSGLTNDRSVAGLLNADASWGGSATASQIDSAAQALLQAKLPDGSYLIPSAQSTAGYQYGEPNVTLIGTSVLKADQATASIAWDVTPTDRFEVKYYYQNAPVTKPFGYSQVGGFPVTQNNGSQVVAFDNTTSLGTHLNWEQRLGFVRMGSYGSFKQTIAGGTFGVGGGSSAIAPGMPGLTVKNFADQDQYSQAANIGPASVFTDMGYYQNRLNPSTNLIAVLGKHTVVVGGGYAYSQLNITNNRDGIEQVNVNGFDNFLQGRVHDSNFIQSVADGRNNANRYYRENEISSYAQDKWQYRSNLSITAGVRYDYHGGLTEKYGDMFNFDPKVYDVQGSTQDLAAGFTVNNAGFVVAGNNKYFPTSGVTDSTLRGRQWGVSPRLGFAWSPGFAHNKLVISGGSGIYYDRGELFTYLSQPAGGQIGGPFGVTESAPLVGYVTGNGSTLENPRGSASANPSANPSIIKQALQAQLNTMTGPASDPSLGLACGGIDSQSYPGYLDCTPTLNFGAYDRDNVLPYTINYTLGVQWQPTSTLATTIGYTGNRGRHAVLPLPLNEPGIATSTHPIWGETATYGFEVLNQNNIWYDNNPNSGSYGYGFYSPIAAEPWNSYTGGNTDFRAPFIGYNPNAADFKTAGVSAYDALQLSVQKRLSHQFAAGGSYTWSHALDEQSDLGLFFTGDDPSHLRDSWASADYDRTHVLSANFQFVVPNAAKAHSFGSYLVNDWNLSGITILQSGQPFSLYEYYGAVGSINFGDYPNLMNPVLGIKDPSHPKSALTGNKGSMRTSGGDYIPAIDPSQIAINYVTPGTNGVPVSTGTDPQDIYQTAFNKGQRNIFRQSPQKRLDFSIRKSFHPTERLNVQYDFNIFNLTNTTSLDVPQDQAQIRQAYACSDSAIIASPSNYLNCTPGSYYINYGQIVTGNDPADQQSTRTNLDQIPYVTGSGKSIRAPLQNPDVMNGGPPSCSAPYHIANKDTCPNNAANFGSATGSIGGNRAVTMGLHITF